MIAAGGLSGAALIFAAIEHIVWQGRVDSFASMGCDADLADRGGAQVF